MTSGHTSGAGFGNARAALDTAGGSVTYYPLSSLTGHGIEQGKLDRLPMTVKILLENLLRNAGNGVVRDAEIEAMANWSPGPAGEGEFPFYPARVLLQDFTGVPAAVDLAAMRSAMARLGGDPRRINPLVPADLVIDHSVQVDYFGSANAFAMNVEREYERNLERYALLRWTQQAFENFRVVPPGRGIVHQINLEYLAAVVFEKREGNDTIV
jgi:aconitate hydratase